MQKSKLVWTIIRTIGFVTIGLMNTVLIKPEDIGTWKNYVGYAFIVVAVFDIIFLLTKLKKKNK